MLIFWSSKVLRSSYDFFDGIMMILLNPFHEPFGVTITIGHIYGGVFATATLILLLSFKEIVSASKFYDRLSEDSLNTAIIPLLFVFFTIVLLKTLEVLYP